MRYRFDEVVVDTGTEIVTVRGERLDLPPRVFSTLGVLLERHDEIVSRDELQAAVWPNAFVDPNSVTQAVRAVRVAVPGAGARIQTVPRRGYCFTGPVQRLPEADISVSELLTTAPEHTAAADEGRPLRGLAAAAIGAAACMVLLAGAAERSGVRAHDSDVLYRQGTALLGSRRATDLRNAAGRFTRAASLDRHHYDARAALAEAQYLLAFYAAATEGDAVRAARRAADEAIRLDPHRSRAYVVRGSVALDADWDLGASGRDFALAIQLDPHDARARHWSAWWCLAAGRLDAARAAMDAAVRLNPLSPAVLTARATFAYLDEDYPSAAADAHRALQIDPEFFRAHLRLGLVHLARGTSIRALARLRLAHAYAPEISETAAALAHAYAATGRGAAAERILEEHDGRLSDYDRAIVFAGFGRDREALDALLAARRSNQLVPGLFIHEPRLEALRGHPEFQALQAALDPVVPEPQVVMPGLVRPQRF